MSPGRRDLLIAGAAIAVLVASVEAAAAQTPAPPPEHTGPRDPRSTGSVGRSSEPLSDKLNRSDGVIRPPANIAPEMTVRPPEPDPGTTRVIPPPGSPGGDPTIEPK